MHISVFYEKKFKKCLQNAKEKLLYFMYLQNSMLQRLKIQLLFVIFLKFSSLNTSKWF